MTKTWKTMVIRLTPEQHAKLLALSRGQDRSMASIVRRLIEEAT